MIELYIKMFKKYFKEKEIVSVGNLVEVRYEDFVSNPLEEAERIYSALDLKKLKSVLYLLYSDRRA